MKSIFIFISAGIVLLTGWGCGDKLKAEGGGKEGVEVNSVSLNQFLVQYESLFRTQFVASGCPGAAVVIVKDSTVIFMKGFGVKEIGKKEPIDVNTLFRLGSLSKGFSSVLTGILAEEGVLSWDDKVVESIPGFNLSDKGQAQRMQVKHILSHSTGLPKHSFTNLVEEGVDYDIILKELPTVKLIGKEGEKYSYQNFTFSLIERIILKKSGRSFSDLMRKRFLCPED